MIRDRIQALFRRRRCTLLGVGPMSKNGVDATIEIANNFMIPIILIASRRQIDSADFGGGYVNNWTTEEFADYVSKNDRRGQVILARDHGGPWQNDKEKDAGLSLRRAMESAKRSYKADIESGFEIIHIDTSVDIHGQVGMDEALFRIFELYEYCWNVARNCGKEILFEIGTEEQSGGLNTQEEFECMIERVFEYCDGNSLPRPSFVVAQTGTKVLETQNVGTFDSPFRIPDELPVEIQVPRIIDVCNKHQIYLKEHNCDYLSDEALSWHPRLGIHSANVAPEFGVCESQALVKILNDHDCSDLSHRFLNLALDSGKWKKWLIPNSTTTDSERGILAGHYVFSDPKFAEIKTEAVDRLKLKNIDLDDYLKGEVKNSILRYLRLFNMIDRDQGFVPNKSYSSSSQTVENCL